MSADAEVTIAGRAFTLGAVYEPRTGAHHPAPRRLLRYEADNVLPGGRVRVAMVPSGKEHVMAETEWAAWAGEPVGDGSGKVGR